MISVSYDRDELFLLLFLSILSIFFIYNSFFISQEAAIMPRIAAGLLLMCVLILLFRDFLPENLQDNLKDSSEIFTETADLQNKTETELNVSKDDLDTKANTISELKSSNSVFLVISMFSYVILGYLIGLLWATPMYVATYTLWAGRSKKIIAILTLFSFVIAFLFMDMINISIDHGIIQDWWL